MLPGSLTALVLAGTRPGGDPLARHAGVSHKALIDIGGEPMIARVLRAVAAAPAVARIVVAIDQPELLAGCTDCGKPVTTMPTGRGPSASVAAALGTLGTPLLVTTADHALLQPQWITEFLAAPTQQADAVLAVARRAAVLAAAPESERTWLRFSEDAYSGCNLFLLRTPAAARVVDLWQTLEAERKRPLTLVGKLGFSYVLRYQLGMLSLAAALARLSRISGAGLQHVVLNDGRAAIDVDKPADLALVRQLLARG
jgi:GTP:adenosylcobinamide-phosphate guanylyltransferase